MEYLLQHIHNYVYGKLQPAQLFDCGNTDNTDLSNHIRLALQALPGNIMQKICSANSCKEKRTLVQSTQSSAIIIANQLYSYIQTIHSWPLEEAAKQEAAAFYQNIIHQLMSSLEVLNQFSQYLDLDQPLPLHLFDDLKATVLTNIHAFSDEWKRRLEPAFIKMILAPARHFISPDSNLTPTYRQWQYLETLLKKLKTLSLSCPENAEKAMVYLLISLNFNEENFIVFALEKLEPPVSDEGSAGDLLEYQRLLHSLKRMHPIPGLSLYPQLPSCIYGITECIQQEILLIDKHYSAQSSTQSTHENKKHEKVKFHTRLTISQLGYLLYILHETGIFVCKPIEKLFGLVSFFVSTLRSSSYPPASLKKSYYQHSPLTKQIVKDYLFTLINEINRTSRICIAVLLLQYVFNSLPENEFSGLLAYAQIFYAQTSEET